MDLATRSSAASRRGFSLVELLISLTLASVLLAAVLSSNVAVIKSQLLLGNYAAFNARSRSSLETLADDVRQMRSITIANDGFSGTIPNSAGSGTVTVTYRFDSVLGRVNRIVAGKTTIQWDRVRTCRFTYYGAGTMNAAASPPRMNRGTALTVGTSTKVKQVQLDVTCLVSVLGVKSGQETVSAQFSARP